MDSNGEADDAVVEFLRTLLGGKEYSDAEATKLHIRHPSALKTVFTSIIGVLEPAQQIKALEALINLVRNNCANIEACTSVGMQKEILRFLSDRGLFADPSLPMQVLKKILRLFLYLSNHSVNSEDIRAMLGVFRSVRMVHDEPDDLSVSYYLSTLEMIARDSFGPPSFFDLSGQFSGLMLPVLDAFPNNGYTFCAWIKFEFLPEEAAPLFTFCGKTGVGIMCSFVRASLMVTCFDKKKNDGHVELPDLITPGRWHFLCITHTHRQFRGSKLDVYLNSELRQSLKLAYPNTALMAPVVKSYIAMRESNGANALRVLLGPTALFGQALPSNIISNIKSVDEYDALVFQFNSYITSSSTSSGTAAAGSAGASAASTGSDGLLLAYDARHCDRLKGLCYDSSGNGHHAAAASAGVRLRHAGTFKQAVAQLGGPLVCLPLLVTSSSSSLTSDNDAIAASESTLTIRSSFTSSLGVTAQFDEDADFLKQINDMIARPLGVRCIPKVLLLIAEIMRHSLVNKFIFRRNHGVRLTALLVRSLPPKYLTSDLLTAIERLRSAVISDRTLSDEIYKFLLFNFRVWVNATVELQGTVFDKLEVMTRRETSALSAVSTRHFLRCLSWIYWKEPNSTSLRRARHFSNDEIALLRKRVLAIIKIVLCESQPAKSTNSSVIGFATKGKEPESQLSYESTRALIFCMIGKATNPSGPALNADGKPSLQENGEASAGTGASSVAAAKHITDGEADAGSVIENVPEADLPDLIQLLIELSVQPTAPAGLLDLFARLGGLRIWLPLLEFSNDIIRVMTLRLLRTYLYLKCGCSQEREKFHSPDKIHLSIGDAYLIMRSLKPEKRPVSMGVYSELLLMILGIQVTESDMKALDGKTEAYDLLIDEEILSRATIWHGNMMFPFLSLVRLSSVTIRMVAIRHLKIIFASSTPASAINRHVLIFSSIMSVGGTTTDSSTTEQVPIIEAILSLRGDQQLQQPPQSTTSFLFGIVLNGCPGKTLSQLREMILNPLEPEEVRINALYSIIANDDVDFVRSLLVFQDDGDRKKQTNSQCYNEMSNRMKLALVELLSMFQPSGCVDYITSTSYDLISSIICLEVKTNEMAWFLLQDPFTTLSRFITSADELEVVVVSLLKATLDKMNEMLTAEMKVRANQEAPSRDSALWRNAESLATLAAAVVLHYDPDTLGRVDPNIVLGDDQLNIEAGDSSSVFWRCERAIWNESELVDSILAIWQHFTTHFHSDSDASFARRASNAQHRHNSVTSRDGGPPSPRQGRDVSRTSSGRLSFGFGLLPSGNAPALPNGTTTISARPHPGGPMRQVLQLLLRSFYLIFISDDEESDQSEPKLRLPSNALFFARINKLEYFINAMGLGRELSQYESSFTPSRAGSGGGSGSAGLVTTSNNVKAAPGDETTLLLWFVPELALLISKVRRKFWSDSAVKLASILASLVPLSLRSSDDLKTLLSQSEFATNNQEVRRRDGFYHEQMAHAREGRAMRRREMLEGEELEIARAKAELARIGRSTRTTVYSEYSSSPTTDQVAEDQVWLQRVKAKDIDDWMKLRVLLKWGIRHIWGKVQQGDAFLSDNDGLAALSGVNEFWRLDIYTSSNWVRCRLLPDTDDTAADHAKYDTTNNVGLKSSEENFVDAFGAIIVDGTNLENPDLFADGTEHAYDDDEDYVDGDTDDGGNESPGNNSRERNVSVDGENDTLVEVENGNSTSLEAGGEVQNSGEPVPDILLGSVGTPSKPLQDVELVSSTNMVVQNDIIDVPTRKRGDTVAVSADLAGSVKSAKDKIPIIGTISSRISTGFLRIKSVRGASEDETSLASDYMGPTSVASPTMTVTVASDSATATGFRKSLSGLIDDGSEDKVPDPLDIASQEEEVAATTTNPASPPAVKSPSRSLRNFPSKHEHWKTLSASYRTKAYLVLPSGVMVYGSLRIGTSTIVFEGDRVTTLKDLAEQSDEYRDNAQSMGDAYVSELKRRVWGVRVIRVIHRRRFLMDIQNGIELYFVDGSSCLFGVETNGEADLIYATLKERKPPCLSKWGKRLLTADRMFSKSKWTEMWVRREISNFEYLMLLNISAGRSYNDITQYPVFPWILKDYDSNELHLDDIQIYRDLRKPIGAQTDEAMERAKKYYESCDPKSQLPPYHFSTPYSHMRSVLYFLVRLSPFTSAVFDGKEDVTKSGAGLTASFNSVKEAFEKCTSEDGHYFELPPEFFYLSSFLVSDHSKILAKEDNSTAGLRRNVALPNWAASEYDFIRQHRLALESDYVSENLHHWIDLVFGFKQSGSHAVGAHNTYHIACYPERLDMNTLNQSVRSKLTQRGTIPLQLFRKPHPMRMTHDESLEARFPAAHATAVLSSRRQVRRHDLTSKHAASISTIRFSNAMNHGLGLSGPGLGSGTGMGAHSTNSNDHGMVVYTTDTDGMVLAKRYLNSVPDQARVCPFSFVEVDQWWKLPSGCLVNEGVVFYEQMISCGYWDGSWRIHWSADGELLQRIAFHKKPILCMARSEDDFTGDLALAFGSEDCTVSVWALSKVAATRSRRMFTKKELPVGGLPWVLLYGHTDPVVAVALNVDLDVVVSSSKGNTILIHALRAATPLHTIAIMSPKHSLVSHLTISPLGDILIHAISEEHESTKSKSRANSIVDENAKNILMGAGKSASPVQITDRQSELYLVSINGLVISHDKLVDSEGKAQVLLDRAVFFTRSGEYIITATTGSDAAIEVRDAGMPSSVARRIECKRDADLTCISLSQDERCIICGYADGSVIAYALHFGISDGCTKNIVGLDKKAREQEAAAIARAQKRDMLKQEAANRREELFPSFLRGPDTGNGLWTRQGKMPAEPYLSAMQERFALLKQPCVSGEEAYEKLLVELWYAIYSQQPFHKEKSTGRSSIGVPIEEGTLLDLPVDPSEDLQFERVGESWSRLGFQRPDPTTDFRAGGMLSLNCLVYFATHYTTQAVRMITSQVPGSHENTYPWGPAGINITCMVARIFWKFDGELCRDYQSNWPLFGAEDGFYQMFSEVFILFDYLWNEMNANYGSFSMVIQATSNRVLDVLEEAKGDISAFLVELRSQSLSTTSGRRRPSSRSMEDFLTTINSNIAGAVSNAEATGFTSNGNSFLPATPPGGSSSTKSSPRSSWSFSQMTQRLSLDPLNLGSSTSSSSTTTTTTTTVILPPAPTAVLVSTSPVLEPASSSVPAAFDPFAGNDIRGLEAKSKELQESDDPFACLM